MKLSTTKILALADGSVGRITINNPDRRNAISPDMWEGISEAFDAFNADPLIRCVVMAGAGDKAFASGADISQFKENRSNAEAADAYARISMAGRQKMLGCEKPFIAQIRGFCMGGGLGIALAADIRIASEDSQFGVPAARLSIAYDRVNLGNLIALVGPSKAKEILITDVQVQLNPTGSNLGGVVDAHSDGADILPEELRVHVGDSRRAVSRYAAFRSLCHLIDVYWEILGVLAANHRWLLRRCPCKVPRIFESKLEGA